MKTNLVNAGCAARHYFKKSREAPAAPAPPSQIRGLSLNTAHKVSLKIEIDGDPSSIGHKESVLE